MMKPDLIISDLMMPGMTGIQLIDALKKEEATKFIPVVVVTGGNMEVQREALDSGAVAVLSKPVHRKDLLAVIQSVFQTVAS
jgi:CheY-like chemotaxis protein